MPDRPYRERIGYGRAHPVERSLWLIEALAGEHDLPPLSESARVDFCIVGGGYTGLWTALRIKQLEPSADVCLLEADICGGGPSGRNGGFMDPLWVKFTALRAICGEQEAVRIGELSVRASHGIEQFCDANRIDAQIRRAGGVWTATHPTEIGSWRPTGEALAKLGHDVFRELDREEIAARTGSDVYLAGVFDEEQATVQPALLARGLRRVALERGVRIHEHSPVTQLRRDELPAVETDSGASVTASHVVLATGPWLTQVRELRDAFAVIGTDMVATEPIPDWIAGTGLESGLGVSDSRMLVNYYRTTQDGRIAWGKGGGSLAYGGRIGASFHGSSPRPGPVIDSLRWHYPTLADVRITNSWTGPVDRSLAGVPFFASLPDRPRILFGGGYSGNGVVPSYLGGQILASLALGLDDEYARCGLVRQPVGSFPSEPLRWIGGEVVRRAVTRADRANNRGARVDPLTRRLMRLAPPGPSEPRSGAGDAVP
jgi:glycine/D-amino acid oxidase-like deaminating enzyme